MKKREKKKCTKILAQNYANMTNRVYFDGFCIDERKKEVYDMNHRNKSKLF